MCARVPVAERISRLFFNSLLFFAIFSPFSFKREYYVADLVTSKVICVANRFANVILPVDHFVCGSPNINRCTEMKADKRLASLSLKTVLFVDFGES